MEDPELEALRQRRMADMQQGGQQQAEAKERAKQMEVQKQAMMRQILTPEARDRMANIRAANPEMANSVEMQLIQLAQSGRLPGMINDTMLKDILVKITPQRREITIERR
jgi:programmed cell death protein 5